jgi:hypothetical protein
MSELFNIWNPYHISATEFAFDVTPADADLINKGNASFIVACLQACHISASPVDWQVQACRQSYYSDYLHSRDWHAQWDIVWCVDVRFSAEITFYQHLQVFPLKVSAQDETAIDCDEPALDHGPVLVIATFPVGGNVEPTISQSLNEWKVATSAVSDIQLKWRRYSNGIVQARAVIERVSFPDCIEDLQLLQAQWRQAGGVCHWRELLRQMQ